mmetsp:Transcript_58263/g.162423  ORF Transcript_58263/g.162423 Transcript_58263/m.162423 type:complete len:400 (+) Transcript_58263:902-2101(+)
MSSSEPCGRCEGGSSCRRTTSSKVSSQIRCLMIASMSKAPELFGKAPPISFKTSSRTSPSCWPSMPIEASARRAAKCVIGWSRWTSSNEFIGRSLAETSPRSDQCLSCSCSCSSFSTSSSKDLRRLSISYNDVSFLAAPASASPSASSSCSSSSLSSSSSSPPSPSASTPACMRLICSSSSLSSSERSSASSEAMPSLSSSSSSPSSSSKSPSSFKPAFFSLEDFAALPLPASGGAKKSENLAFLASSSSSPSSPTSIRPKSLSSASSSRRILPVSAMSANFCMSSRLKKSSSRPSPSEPLAGSALVESVRPRRSGLFSSAPSDLAGASSLPPVCVRARAGLLSQPGPAAACAAVGSNETSGERKRRSTTPSGASESFARLRRKCRRRGTFCTSSSSQI